jgi:hypothetical protein
MLTTYLTSEANEPIEAPPDTPQIDLADIPPYSTILLFEGQESPHTGYLLHPSRLAQVRVALLDLERCEVSRDACYGRLEALPAPDPCPDVDGLAMWRGVGYGLLAGVVGGLVLGVVVGQ